MNLEITSIPNSKTKIILLLATAIIFVFIGIWILAYSGPGPLNYRGISSEMFFYGIAVISIACFGALVPWLFIKLLDQTPGLEFRRDGLVENSNLFSIGFIAWDDILDIEIKQIQNERIIYLLLRDPEKYIRRLNPISRAICRNLNYLIPSPVAITSVALRVDFDILVELLQKKITEHCQN